MSLENFKNMVQDWQGWGIWDNMKNVLVKSDLADRPAMYATRAMAVTDMRELRRQYHRPLACWKPVRLNVKYFVEDKK
jgi:hypothetical protein